MLIEDIARRMNFHAEALEDLKTEQCVGVGTLGVGEGLFTENIIIGLTYSNFSTFRLRKYADLLLLPILRGAPEAA